jgi:hypothetical protein
MASITTRETGTTGVGGVTRKNAPLSNAEIDNNFINLNADKIEVSNAVSTNTNNAVVRRDSSGGFSAGAISATSLSLTTVLPIGSGGTGQTTYTNGQLLIGNSSGSLTKATLNGTTNRVVITNASGSITISTPQDLNTTSLVQFGSIGVGTAASGVTGRIDATSVVSTSITETSSITLKENINPLENALESIAKLSGVIYDRKDGSSNNEPGFIAEDVLKILPNLVTSDKNGNAEGIRYTKVVAYLVEAIKELKQEIDTLKGVK